MTGAAAVIILSYLLGSVPFGLLIAQAVRGVDIRTIGSGNIGMANVMRACGPAAGAAVLVVDALKGALPVLAARGLELSPWAAALAGLAAVVGHNWSVYLGFRGGKGVATSLGVVIALAPAAALALVVVWAVLVAATRISSVGSMAALALSPLVMWLFGQPAPNVFFCAAAAVLGLYRHRENMTRLLQGRENRITPGGRGSPPDRGSGGVKRPPADGRG